MGVGEGELLHFRRGALLHDIGKLGISENILNKPGPLNDAEWEIMRSHPGLAYQLLSTVNYLAPALDIPHYHHERWDGSGYPDGLREEQIPFPARLFAVVDVYDALTSARPYRPAWPRQAALEYIQQQSGKLFDPAVVKAFLQVMKER
jgi:HD-GYP domain-containing protein (c-di-GMP phosphodiesterase class II)